MLDRLKVGNGLKVTDSVLQIVYDTFYLSSEFDPLRQS